MLHIYLLLFICDCCPEDNLELCVCVGMSILWMWTWVGWVVALELDLRGLNPYTWISRDEYVFELISLTPALG